LIVVLHAGAQYAHGLILVLDLTALVLALHHDARGQVRQPHGGFRSVDVLAARAGGAEQVDAQVVRVDLHIHFLGLGQYRDRRRARVDAPSGLGFGHALHAMRPALKLEPGIRPPAGDHADGFLAPAQLRLGQTRHIHRIPPPFGIPGIHLEKVHGKERRLFPARARADLHDDVLIVVGVLGGQGKADFLLQAGCLGLERGKFLPRQLFELRVAGGERFPRGGDLPHDAQIFPRAGQRFLQVRVLFEAVAPAFGVRHGVGLGQEQAQFQLPGLQPLYLLHQIHLKFPFISLAPEPPFRVRRRERAEGADSSVLPSNPGLLHLPILAHTQHPRDPGHVRRQGYGPAVGPQDLRYLPRLPPAQFT